MKERYQKLKELFQAALDHAPAERGAFLDEACQADPTLRSEVEELLAAHAQTSYFDVAALLPDAVEDFTLAEGVAAEPMSGQHLGPYRVLRKIGHGGMGTVYLAERADQQFKKQVALKVLRSGSTSQALHSDMIVRRFRQERQILASFEHPNIARLLDGGATPDGLPYLVLEYIEGQPLNEYCDEHQLSLLERLRLFRTVCTAVHYAHQNLVVHRDLKPSNILITPDGTPKLLDFGIAKILNPETFDQTIDQTLSSVRLMTPAYASPEQVRGETITTASDVYALGMVLYELLTGHRPYQISAHSLHETARIVCEVEPPKPSTVVTRVEVVTGSDGSEKTTITPEQVSRARNEPPEKLRRRLTGDLDNIVLMALRKEPARRYSSVEHFSEDIRRYLEGLPVIARKDTFTYRASKFVQRHRAGVAAAALFALALIAGIITILWQARIARQQRDVAQAAQAKAERISQFLSAALSYSDPSAAVAGTKNRRDATINQMLDDIAPRIETELTDQPEVRASIQRTVGIAYSSQLRIAEAERYLNAALETQLKIYGADHQETAFTLYGLAAVQGAKGDYAGAEKTLQKVIATYRSQPPKEEIHIQVFAATLVTFGEVHWTRGDFKAAESAYSEALTFALQLQNRERELIANAKAGLGFTRYAQGRLEEAALLLREALREYRSLPQTRWKWSNVLNQLAQVLTWKKELDEALTLLRESEALSLEIFGDNNGFYPRSLYLRAYALCLKGDYSEAAKTLDKAEAIYDRYFPDNKIHKANMYDARGMILTRNRRAPQGETFGRQATELYQSLMSTGAGGITLARIHWAESLSAQKKYDQAERVLLEAYKDASKVQGAEHWRTKDAARELVKLYEAWNKPDLAAKYRALFSASPAN